MNEWECEAPGCPYKVVGLGSAVGLRAIGWYFRLGSGMSRPLVYCPVHRPDAIRCEQADGPEECHVCAGRVQAKVLQAMLWRPEERRYV